jgi:hypothetical protein
VKKQEPTINLSEVYFRLAVTHALLELKESYPQIFIDVISLPPGYDLRMLEKKTKKLFKKRKNAR